MADGAGAASPFCARASAPDNSYVGMPAVPRAIYAWCEPTLAAIKTGATRKARKFVRSISDGAPFSNLTEWQSSQMKGA